jgi:hypothetical protein
VPQGVQGLDNPGLFGVGNKSTAGGKFPVVVQRRRKAQCRTQGPKGIPRCRPVPAVGHARRS